MEDNSKNDFITKAKNKQNKNHDAICKPETSKIAVSENNILHLRISTFGRWRHGYAIYLSSVLSEKEITIHLLDSIKLIYHGE